jgi:hypothetical protein
MLPKNIIEDIRNIISILFENNKRLFDQLFSVFSDKIHEYHDTHSVLTNDFTISWYIIYSVNDYHQLSSDIENLIDKIPKPEPGSLFEESYNKLTTMHDYFSNY